MGRFARSRSGFAGWRKERPFVGALLTMLAGVEMFFSGQLDIGKIHVQLGIEGFQATIIPVLLVLLGLLAMLMPMHRIFYGVLSLVVSVYSLVGVNLGGFFVGMLLGAVGGVLVVSWMPKKVATAASDDGVLGSEVVTDAARGNDHSAVGNTADEHSAPDHPAEPLPLVRRRS